MVTLPTKTELQDILQSPSRRQSATALRFFYDDLADSDNTALVRTAGCAGLVVRDEFSNWPDDVGWALLRQQPSNLSLTRVLLEQLSRKASFKMLRVLTETLIA